MTVLEGAGVDGFKQKITSTGSALVRAQTELISSAKSRNNQLYGLGTGRLTIVQADFSLGSILWMQNSSSDKDLYVQKLIAGWDGGLTNKNSTIFTLLFYGSEAPTAGHTLITDQRERPVQGTVPPTSGDVLAYKWDNSTSGGMTSGAGGYAQIPNTWDKGNDVNRIDGEIILSPGVSLEIKATPDTASSENGQFHISVVYYFEPAGSIE